MLTCRAPKSALIAQGRNASFRQSAEGGFVRVSTGFGGWRGRLGSMVVLGAVWSVMPRAALWAGSAPTVAVAVTMGQMEVNHLKADGTANVPEGAQLKTHESAARLQFRSGGRATLGTESQALIFTGRLVLESGSGLVNGSNSIALEALGFRVLAGEREGSALVEHRGRFIQVSSVAGVTSVYDQGGTLVARVQPGTPLTFEPSGFVRNASDDPDKTDPKDGSKPDANDAAKSTGKEAAKATAKTGLSTAAKVGIGVGVTAGVGLGVALPMAILSR